MAIAAADLFGMADTTAAAVRVPMASRHKICKVQNTRRQKCTNSISAVG